MANFYRWTPTLDTLADAMGFFTGKAGLISRGVMFGVAALALAPAPLSANQPLRPGEAGSTSSPATGMLDKDHGWPTGTIREQMDRDPTLIPFGKGSIFVPAMTNPLDEPFVTVWRGEAQVARGTTGQRIAVLPGSYRVRMGTGAVEQQFSVPATVEELSTTVVPVTWAGLAIHMADERYNSVRGSYEVIRVETREYVDVGFGADETAGETVTTWILPPGLYKIVKVGETYRARRDFATVRLMPGRLTDFLLIVDPETEEFQGGGEVPREELFIAQPGEVLSSLILGGDVSLKSRDNVLGDTDGISLAFKAFVDGKIAFDLFESPLLLQLQLEESQIMTPDRGWLNDLDRLDLDGLYVYKLYPWLGPYVRGSIETGILESRQVYEEPVVARVRRGEDDYRERLPRNFVRLRPPFGLFTIKEGTGMHVRVFKELWAETTVRAGVGARHTISNGLITPLEQLPDGEGAGLPVPSSLNPYFQLVPTTHLVGVETTLLATLRPIRWVLINLELDGLMPFDDPGAIVVELEGTIALKLTKYTSVNYVFRFLRNPALQPAEGEQTYSMAHDIFLRFSIDLP